MPRKVVETHSANMHMIPANDDIERRLKLVCAGNLVHIKGYLVEVTNEDRFHWKSSLTRSGPAWALASWSGSTISSIGNGPPVTTS